MKYFLGVDQGGTKTQVAVCAADGTVAGTAKGGGLIFYLDDPGNTSTATARGLAEKVLADAGLAWDCLSAVCGGLNGLDWPHETPLHEARLREGLGIADVTAVNDCVIALRAGSAAPNRCIVCAGTGMNIAAQSENGAEYVYGYFLPNRMQGGAALGGAVVEAVTEAAAGVRPPTRLSDAVLECSGCASVEQFLTATTTRQMAFAPKTLVPGLLDAALAGDAAAVQIIAAFTRDVAAYMDNTLARFLPAGRDVDVVFSGGVFKRRGRVIVDGVIKILAPKHPRARFINARFEPVHGAMLMLLEREHGGRLPPDVAERFRRGCMQHRLIRCFQHAGKLAARPRTGGPTGTPAPHAVFPVTPPPP